MTVDELHALLENGDANTRREAVIAASRTRDRALSQPLLVALGDSDWRVREEAVRAVSEVAVEHELLAGLVEGLSQGANVGLRNAAREVLHVVGAKAAPTLVAALGEVEQGARKFVIEALSCGGGEDAIDALLAAARSPDSLLAVSAMDALSQLGGERAVAALTEKLDASESFERAAALDALVRLDVAIPWPRLEPLLEDRVLWRVALSALGRTGDERAVPRLVAALAEKSQHLVSRALLGLHRLHASNPALRPAFARALSSLPPPVRVRLRALVAEDDLSVALAAAIALACARDPEALPLALELCGRGVASVELAMAFAAWGDEAIALASHIAAGSGSERAAAIELAADLCVLSSPSASTRALLRDVVREALGRRDPVLRRASLRAIAHFAQGWDADLLLAHALGDDAELAQLAATALASLAEREADPVRRVLASAELSGHAQTALAELAVQVGVHDALGRLRSALLSDEKDTRIAALAGLACLHGNQEALELLALALTDEQSEVQIAALESLSRAHIGEGAIAALLAFETTDPDVQAALSRALVSLQPRLPDDQERLRSRLRELARHGSAGARRFSLQGLARLADPALDELLTHALADEDREIVKQAISALAEAGGGRSAGRIARALSHAAWDVRRLAAIRLGHMRAHEASAALREQLARESDEYVRVALREALSSLEVR